MCHFGAIGGAIVTVRHRLAIVQTEQRLLWAHNCAKTLRASNDNRINYLANFEARQLMLDGSL